MARRRVNFTGRQTTAATAAQLTTAAGQTTAATTAAPVTTAAACVEPSRTSHPTVDGFDARTDHIPGSDQSVMKPMW